MRLKITPITHGETSSNNADQARNIIWVKDAIAKYEQQQGEQATYEKYLFIRLTVNYPAAYVTFCFHPHYSHPVGNYVSIILINSSHISFVEEFKYAFTQMREMVFAYMQNYGLHKIKE